MPSPIPTPMFMPSPTPSPMPLPMLSPKPTPQQCLSGGDRCPQPAERRHGFRPARPLELNTSSSQRPKQCHSGGDRSPQPAEHRHGFRPAWPLELDISSSQRPKQCLSGGDRSPQPAEQRHGFRPARLGLEPAADFTGHAEPSERGAPNSWSRLVFDMCKRHNPTKLQMFDQIIEKNAAQLPELYQALKDEYEKRPRGTVPNSWLGPAQCRLCLQEGHYGNECPLAPKVPPKTNRHSIEQIQAAESPRWRQALRQIHGYPDPGPPPPGARGVVTIAAKQSKNDVRDRCPQTTAAPMPAARSNRIPVSDATSSEGHAWDRSPKRKRVKSTNSESSYHFTKRSCANPTAPSAYEDAPWRSEKANIYYL